MQQLDSSSLEQACGEWVAVLQQNNILQLLPLPAGAQLLGLKWVLTIKPEVAEEVGLHQLVICTTFLNGEQKMEVLVEGYQQGGSGMAFKLQ
jgi:hypothetical protein